MRTAPSRANRPTPSRRRLAAVAVLALALAACGEEVPDMASDEGEDADAGDDVVQVDDATVAIGSTDLGEVLVDGDGMTLYLFDPDDQGESTCYDDCAAAWPPLIDEDPVAGDGVDAALLNTTERDDGSLQVTYDGWPVYLWASDQEPGDATGQGVQDAWWVVETDGTPVRDAGDDVEERDDEDDGAGY